MTWQSPENLFMFVVLFAFIRLLFWLSEHYREAAIGAAIALILCATPWVYLAVVDAVEHPLPPTPEQAIYYRVIKGRYALTGWILKEGDVKLGEGEQMEAMWMGRVE